MKYSITLKSFYRIALWLPLILPAVSFTVPTGIHFLFFASLVFGGAQYLLFALFVSYYYRNATAAELARFSLKAPIIFTPFCFIGLFLYGFVVGREDFASYSSLLLSLLALLFGYFYVALAHLLAFVLKKIGFIKN